jgi:hypothetical protein
LAIDPLFNGGGSTKTLVAIWEGPRNHLNILIRGESCLTLVY